MVEHRHHVLLLEGVDVNIDVDDLVIGWQSPEALDLVIGLIVKA